MLKTIIFILFPFMVIGQNYTINSKPNSKILIIGIDNVLSIEGFTRSDSLHIQAPKDIISRKSSRFRFVLTVIKPMENVPIVLKNREEVLDTILVDIKRIEFYQFLETNNYGLIKSGTYSLEIIKDLKSIKLGTSIPNREVIPVSYYRIEIYNENEVLFSKTMKGGSLNHPEIVKALSKLKRRGFVDIRRIMAKLPWDCGQRALPMSLQVL